MHTMAFHPQLFEHRATATDALAEHDCCLFQDFASIDILHESHGLEVCGIATEGEARAILRILQRVFPSWRFGGACYQDHHAGQGWLAEITKSPR
jgi:hypothetical protein